MAQNKPLVLVVDDEPGALRFLERVLGDAGYDVITASNGLQALEIVTPKNPELVLLDIRMPGKTGIEVLEELKTAHPDIAVVMVSGLDDAKTAVQTLRKGASDYLTKPVDLAELVITVERALERRRLILENRSYQLNLEQKVTEQTWLLQQKVRELTALNNLFVRYLNEGFASAERYDRLAGEIIRLTEEIQALAQKYLKEGAEAEVSDRLAREIMKRAEAIQALAKEAEARKMEVSSSSSVEGK